MDDNSASLDPTIRCTNAIVSIIVLEMSSLLYQSVLFALISFLQDYLLLVYYIYIYINIS
jgi:hypothetical protein